MFDLTELASQIDDQLYATGDAGRLNRLTLQIELAKAERLELLVHLLSQLSSRLLPQSSRPRSPRRRGSAARSAAHSDEVPVDAVLDVGLLSDAIDSAVRAASRVGGKG